MIGKNIIVLLCILGLVAGGGLRRQLQEEVLDCNEACDTLLALTPPFFDTRGDCMATCRPCLNPAPVGNAGVCICNLLQNLGIENIRQVAESLGLTNADHPINLALCFDEYSDVNFGTCVSAVNEAFPSTTGPCPN